MTERDQITELEHRIGQATMMAESIALEGGVRRECALRFLGALEVPEAEWPAPASAAPVTLRQSLTTRQGRKVPRMLYEQLGDGPADDDPIVGLVDTPELAALIVAAVNGLGAAVADADGSVTDDTSRVPPAAPEQSGGRVERDTATARTLITGALLAELGRRLYEYENTITWNTTCLSCSAVLDSSVRETFRREQAEEKLTAIRDYCCERTDDYADAGTRQTVAGIRAIIGSDKGDNREPA